MVCPECNIEFYELSVEEAEDLFYILYGYKMPSELIPKCPDCDRPTLH